MVIEQILSKTRGGKEKPRSSRQCAPKSFQMEQQLESGMTEY